MVPLRAELCIWLHKVTFYLLVGDSYVYFLLLLSVFCLGPNEICITFFFHSYQSLILPYLLSALFLQHSTKKKS